MDMKDTKEMKVVIPRIVRLFDLTAGISIAGRRRLIAMALLPVCMVFGLLGLDWQARAALIPIGGQKQLFLDETLIESMHNTCFALNMPIKAPNNPVIRRDRPWEGNYIHYGPVLYDPQQQRFRMWYTSATYTPVPGDVPTNTEVIICYAVSDDGYHWQKPNLGWVEFQGSRENNIVDAKHWPRPKGGILYDARETDPSKRFKAMSLSVAGADRDSTGSPGMRFDLYYSPNAFDWTPYVNNPVIYWGPKKGRWGPTYLMGWDPIREVYTAFMEVCAHRRCPLGRRFIGRAESPDLTSWSKSEPIILPDQHDFPDLEFYSLYTTHYAGVTIGMLWNFRTTDTTILPQFIFSRDGIHWDRRYRQSFIPLAPAPEFDSVAIYSMQPIVHGDEIFIFYGGVNWRSPEQLEQLGTENAHGAIGLAVVPLDRFVSLDGGKLQFSEVVTRSFSFTGKELHLNMRAAFQRWGAGPCDVRVEILDPDYFPIPGYSLQDADRLAKTGLRNRVTWNGKADVSQLVGKPIKLKFYFKNAKLFAFQFVNPNQVEKARSGRVEK